MISERSKRGDVWDNGNMSEPAINIEKSGTRKEELLLHPDELSKIWVLRKALKDVPAVEAMELLCNRIKKTKSNAEFLMALQQT